MKPNDSIMNHHCSQRDKQIERVVQNTAGISGDLQDIIGHVLPAVKTLELPGENCELKRSTRGGE